MIKVPWLVGGRKIFLKAVILSRILNKNIVLVLIHIVYHYYILVGSFSDKVHKSLKYKTPPPPPSFVSVLAATAEPNLLDDFLRHPRSV